MMPEFSIESAKAEHSQQLLQLMYGLAEYEGYAADFAVTEAELLQRAFVDEDFFILVAKAKEARSGEARPSQAEPMDVLLGVLVYYPLPFSYDLKPWFFVKELFVAPASRGLGVGEALLRALAKRCCAEQGSKIRWDVLADNVAAQRFYQRMGARHNGRWLGYEISGAALEVLAS